MNNKSTEGAFKVEAVALVIADQRAIGTSSVRRRDRLHLCQQESTGILLPQRHGRQLAKKTCSRKALRHFLSVSWTTVNAAVIGRCVTCVLKSSRHSFKCLKCIFIFGFNTLHCDESFYVAEGSFFHWEEINLPPSPFTQLYTDYGIWEGVGRKRVAGTGTGSRAISGLNQQSDSSVQSEQRGCDVGRASNMIEEGAAWLGCWSCEWNKEVESGTKFSWWRWDTSVGGGGIWGPPMWLGEDKGLRIDN